MVLMLLWFVANLLYCVDSHLLFFLSMHFLEWERFNDHSHPATELCHIVCK